MRESLAALGLGLLIAGCAGAPRPADPTLASERAVARAETGDSHDALAGSGRGDGERSAGHIDVEGEVIEAGRVALASLQDPPRLSGVLAHCGGVRYREGERVPVRVTRRGPHGSETLVASVDSWLSLVEPDLGLRPGDVVCVGGRRPRRVPQVSCVPGR